jgi:ornithine decarboxylase
MNPRIAEFVVSSHPPTPCLIVDLDVVAERYTALAEALPEAAIHYAVKANPELDVLTLLTEQGSLFDVASPGEIDACLEAGADPRTISYGNTIKKRADIRYAFEHGVTLFAVDSEAELVKIAEEAPGAAVFCRLLTSGQGADWPLSRKFGCSAQMAADLLVRAQELGLRARGVSFHVGSQQRDLSQWGPALEQARWVFDRAAEAGVILDLVNLGGGFPAQYLDDIPVIEAYAAAIRSELRTHFGDVPVQLIVEPGRYVVGDAGVLLTEVVLVSRKDYADEERWVFLDTGIFGGLAEALGEAIKYRITTFGADDTCADANAATGPVVLAGPTCDSVDVLYEDFRYQLPLDLQVGDKLAILSAGAYTKAYCTDGFNGFTPMPAYCLPRVEDTVSSYPLEVPAP